MNIMKLNEEIEAFYTLFEKNLRNYKRPDDYRERYIRNVYPTSKRNVATFNKEGRAHYDKNS